MTYNPALAILCPEWVMRCSGIEPDEWQRDLLHAEERNVLVLCSRQAGKSTTAAAKALHKAIAYPGALVLLLSPSLRQSSELFRKIAFLYNPIAGHFPAEQQSALTMTLKNGSRIVSLPGTPDTIRGYSSVALLIVDEAAMVDPELFFSVRPMLAVSQGQMVSLTTPKGRRGVFYEDWTREDSSARKITVTADQIGRITPDFLDGEKDALGVRFWEQEYWCVFHDLTDSLFSLDQIEAATTDKIEALTFDEPAPGDSRVQALEL
jgi:hypothetical protein